MKRITAIWKHAFLLIVILSAVCLLGNTQKVSAASYSETTCKVIFANAKGQTGPQADKRRGNAQETRGE